MHLIFSCHTRLVLKQVSFLEYQRIQRARLTFFHSVDPSGQKEEDVESDLSTRGVQRPAAEDRRKQDRIDELESECESDAEPDIERSKELDFIELTILSLENFYQISLSIKV